VHVAVKDIQTTDHSLEGTRGWRATTYLETCVYPCILAQVLIWLHGCLRNSFKWQ
jgi:hypothetical protein